MNHLEGYPRPEPKTFPERGKCPECHRVVTVYRQRYTCLPCGKGWTVDDVADRTIHSLTRGEP